MKKFAGVVCAMVIFVVFAASEAHASGGLTTFSYEQSHTSGVVGDGYDIGKENNASVTAGSPIFIEPEISL